MLAEAVLRLILWDEGGIPVMGSSLDLSWLMVHDGVIRRSDEEFSEMTCRGTSAMVDDLVWFPGPSGMGFGLMVGCKEHVGRVEFLGGSGVA